MFSPGEEVLCIDSRWGQFSPGSLFQIQFCPNIPFKGRKYHVRGYWDRGQDFVPGPSYSGPHLWLVEVVNPTNSQNPAGEAREPVFEECQFVRLKKVETDITTFTNILAGRTRVRSLTPRRRKKESA